MSVGGLVSPFLFHSLFFFFISSLVDNEFIYRERKGGVILRNVETNVSTVLIEGKKIVSALFAEQGGFRVRTCRSTKQKMTWAFGFRRHQAEAVNLQYDRLSRDR